MLDVSTRKNTMNPSTVQFFDTLKATYPEKQWHLEPYKAYDSVRHAITFSHNGTSIHNPLLSENTIDEQTDRYGLSEEHAQRMAAHNESYEIHAMGAIPNLDTLFERIRALAVDCPDAATAELLMEMGLYKYHTGGGCMTYAIFNPNNEHILVTDEDGCSLPATMGEAVIGLYDDEGDAKKLFDPRSTS